MCFRMVLRRKMVTSKDDNKLGYHTIEDTNWRCWDSLLSDVEMTSGVINFMKTLWHVVSITDRKVEKDLVKYMVFWKPCNGRAFIK